MMDPIRVKLQEHLATLEPLVGGGGLRLGFSNRANNITNRVTAGWETEARLIKRVLDEDGPPRSSLLDFRERTEQFRLKFPDRSGWTDREGIEWNAALVLTCIDNLLEHIENWDVAEEEFEDEDEDEDEDETI